MGNGSSRRGLGALVLPRRHATDLGWGFIVAWGLIAVFTGTFTSGEGSNLGLFWLASMIGTPLGLLGLAFARKVLQSEVARDVLFICALAGMMLGTVLLVTATLHEGHDGPFVQVCGGAISSLGVAAFTVMWGEHYSKLDMQRIERSAAYAMMLAFGCYALELLLPAGAKMAFPVLLPVLSAICLKVGRVRADEEGSDVRRTPKPFKMSAFVIRCLGVTGTTALISMVWTLIRDGEVSLGHDLFQASVLSGTIVAVLLVLYLSRYSKTLSLGALYRWSLPMTALSVALLHFPGEGFAMTASSTLFAVMPLLNLTTFIHFAELSKTVDADTCSIFGVGRFFVEVGFLLGMLIGPLRDCFAAAPGGAYPLLTMALALLSGLVMLSLSGKELTIGEENEEQEERPYEKPVSLTEACEQLAEDYGLTKREREVLTYLAQGYSLPFIRNELYIAQSTIDTHVGHIYKKMGIHSREELITMVRHRSSPHPCE